MYLNKLFCARNILNCTKSSVCHFASQSDNNKISLYFKRAKLIDSIRLALRSSETSSSFTSLLNDPSLDSFVVSNALVSAPSINSVMSFIESLKTIRKFSHTQHTLYVLAKALAKFKQTAKLKALINGINSGEFPKVAPISSMDLLRWYSTAGDFDSFLATWEDLRASRKQPPLEAYNIVMRIYARRGMNCEAVEILHMMIREGVVPNSRTYTVMIEQLISNGKLELAMDIFSLLPEMHVNRTVLQYSLLIRAFTSANQFDTVKSLLSSIQMDGIVPSVSIRESLHQMQEAGFFMETAKFVQEMMPDDRIKNIGLHEDEDDDNEADSVLLKPWLDPAALANALRDWGPDEVSTLADAKVIWTSRLVCKMIRSLCPAETSWKFFCWVADQPGFSHNACTISRMVTILASHGHADLVSQLLYKVKKEGIKLPFGPVRMIINHYSVSHNGEAALKVFHDVDRLCGPVPKRYLSLLYSTLLLTLAKCKMTSEALDVLDEMILSGIIPRIETFSGLIHRFAHQEDIRAVQRIFSMAKQSGVEPDAYMLKLLICFYCKSNRAILAFRVFEEMRNDNLMPDFATKQLLVKSLWKESKFREAAYVEDRTQGMNNDPSLVSRSALVQAKFLYLNKVYDIYSSAFVRTNSEDAE